MGRSVEVLPESADRPAVEIVRSTRRRKTVSAFVRDGRIVVQVPARLAPEEEARLVAKMVARVTGRDRARRAGGDAELQARADRLADDYLDGVRASKVSWSDRMERRWGSCTSATGEIRISSRLAAMPRYVLDAVLVHELAHLVVPDHSVRFRALLGRFPDAERARGFLEGVEFAGGAEAP